MSDLSRGSTSIGQDVLARLIAAARVGEQVSWADAETDARHEVAALWGGRTPAEQAAPVEVTTEVLVQLAAAAGTAVGARYAAGSSWAPRVELDLAAVRHLVGPIGRSGTASPLEPAEPA
jgi:hypothetical protein